MFPRVHAVGHRELAPLARELAATLSCGPAAVLSSFKAAVAWEPLQPREGPIDLTVPPGYPRRAPTGIRLHRAPLTQDQVTRHRGIPVTTPARTIQDLAAHASPRDLERAINEARLRRLLGPGEPALVPGSRGVTALRSILQDTTGFTRHEAERRLKHLILRAQLPRPEHNAVVAAREVDALWREQRLIVEVDGYATHGTRAAFERDRAKDAHLDAHGHRVLRITWRQIAQEPEAGAARLAAALARRT